MKKHIDHAHKYAAEFIGTFFLTLGVSFSLMYAMPMATPLIASLIVMVFVYAVGPMCGAQLNPAVTLGLFAIKKISAPETAGYILSQCVAALVAAVVSHSLSGMNPMLIAENTPHVAVAEALGAFVLVFAISAVVYNKVHQAASGVAIGGALLAGIMLAGNFSNGILNPAVALGLGSVSIMYILGPIVGGVLAAYAYRALQK